MSTQDNEEILFIGDEFNRQRAINFVKENLFVYQIALACKYFLDVNWNDICTNQSDIDIIMGKLAKTGFLIKINNDFNINKESDLYKKTYKEAVIRVVKELENSDIQVKTVLNLNY